MKKIISILLLFTNLIGFSQNSKTTKILEEGKLLYRLEKASWYGTDDFLERFSNKKDSIGGYLSYQTENNKVNCIFFSRYNNDKILVRYQFDSIPKQEPIKIDTINKNVTEIERDLIEIRQDARDRVYKNTEGFFTFYENTSLNFIPVITKKEKQVFILTASQISGIVLLGNDYILKYSKKNKFKSKIKLHNTIIQFPYKAENSDNTMVSTIHSHVVTDYITSTDICTLLLYKDYVEWKKHYVIGKKHVTIFDLEKEILAVMTRKAWNKIYKNENNIDY
jgi:hypothetical protein